MSRGGAVILLCGFSLLSACGEQNWYQAAQSAQQADCMQQPLADYEDCMAPTKDSFNTYQKKRDSLP